MGTNPSTAMIFATAVIYLFDVSEGDLTRLGRR